MKRWLRYGALVFSCGVLVALAVIVAKSTPKPWTRAQLLILTQQLNEAAAIGVPHDFLMKKPLRKAHAALLSKVEDGSLLSQNESHTYRQLFQLTLHDSQGFLSTFDKELTLISNHAMAQPNNVAGLGIAGHHDHHDLSARRNFQSMLRSLDTLAQSQSFFGRIIHANAVQKDLVDLISHLGVAPHTVSVSYAPPEARWQDEQLGHLFEAMVQHYKAAQAADVHSVQYWQSIDRATETYADLILAVQDQIWRNTSRLERRIAGRFNAIQTFAPPVDLEPSYRRK